MKNKFKQLLIIIIASTLLNSCNQKQTNIFKKVEIGCRKDNANYYRIAENDIRYEIIGKHPVEDSMSAKINCYHFIYNEEGKLCKVEYLVNGKLQNDPYFGVAQIEIKDSVGIQRRYFQDINAKPLANAMGIYSCVYKFNENNYPVSIYNYNEKGKLTYKKESSLPFQLMLNETGVGVKTIRKYLSNYIFHNIGTIEIEWEKDDDGNTIETKYFGTIKNPKYSDDLGVAIVQSIYDKNDNEIEEKYFDKKKQPKQLNNYGITKIQWKYDKYGNKVEHRYFDSNNQLKEFEYIGNAIIRIKYDNNGNDIEKQYFDINDKPVNSKDLGVNKFCFKYDDQGNKIEEKFYGTNNKLIYCRKNGISIVRRKYNNQGKEVENAYFGVNEQPMEDSSGISIVNWKYDEKGNQIEEKYFGKEGKLKEETIFGIAIIQWKYDEQGNRIEETCYGADEKLKNCKDNGIAIIQRKYDENRNIIEEKFFGPDKNPIEDINGITKYCAKYDQNDLQIEESFFGSDGKLKVNKNWGYALARYSFNKNRKKIGGCYYGLNNKLINTEKY